MTHQQFLTYVSIVLLSTIISRTSIYAAMDVEGEIDDDGADGSDGDVDVDPFGCNEKSSVGQMAKCWFDNMFRYMKLEKCFKGYDRNGEFLLLQLGEACARKDVLKLNCFSSCFIINTGIFQEYEQKKNNGFRNITEIMERGRRRMSIPSPFGHMMGKRSLTDQNKFNALIVNNDRLKMALRLLFPFNTGTEPAIRLINSAMNKCAKQSTPASLPKNFYGDCRPVQPLIDCLSDSLMCIRGKLI